MNSKYTDIDFYNNDKYSKQFIKSKLSYHYSNPHIYSYKYPIINKSIHFLLNTFVKSTKFPFVSILLFILVITLNSIQYNNNNRYLQTQVQNSISTLPDSTSFNNILLYIYDTIGINGFVINGISHILFFILTYICLALIEMNIGHIKVLYFLIVCLILLFFIDNFGLAICYNNIYGDYNRLSHHSYCCGSFILYASIGFVLYLIQNNINDLLLRTIVWIIIACVWAGCVVFDYLLSYERKKEGNQKTCSVFFFHAANFLLGLFSGVILGI